jgi:hypothetical protein
MVVVLVGVGVVGLDCWYWGFPRAMFVRESGSPVQ